MYYPSTICVYILLIYRWTMNSKLNSKIISRHHLMILNRTHQQIKQTIFNLMNSNINIIILHNHPITFILFMDLLIIYLKAIKIMGLTIGILIFIMRFIKIIFLKERECAKEEGKDTIGRSFVKNIKNRKNAKKNSHLLKSQAVTMRNKWNSWKKILIRWKLRIKRWKNKQF